MDHKNSLTCLPVIFGPNELGLSTKTTGTGEGSKWETAFVVADPQGIIREVETPSTPDEAPVPPHRIVAVDIDQCLPQESSPGQSHIVGNAVEIRPDLDPDAEPRKLGRAAVFGYDPKTGKGVMVLSPDQAVTKD
ncbi:hypothetical protein [Candidatus Nanosynbacter featherlites]|jgi:hypothetical protein|uniref:Uncharacterized protein n=1 Tax=Candidatus Nanosynbacter featherlites TaxID=2572088 RepID=A0A4V1GDM0_9BACT|nr:hypothetical protein [Candidatus Nanosynbacter featherlites]QCT42256.1 hypothetical protein FBF37_02110 [Candidatus Nanosynbacter featherlites]